jgi:hypothetical protein
MWVAREIGLEPDLIMEPMIEDMGEVELHAEDPNLSLVQECLEGNPAAQRALFDRLLPRLKSTVQRYIWSEVFAQDVLQEASSASFETCINSIGVKVTFRLGP